MLSLSQARLLTWAARCSARGTLTERSPGPACLSFESFNAFDRAEGCQELPHGVWEQTRESSGESSKAPQAELREQCKLEEPEVPEEGAKYESPRKGLLQPVDTGEGNKNNCQPKAKTKSFRKRKRDRFGKYYCSKATCSARFSRLRTLCLHERMHTQFAQYHEFKKKPQLGRDKPGSVQELEGAAKTAFRVRTQLPPQVRAQLETLRSNATFVGRPVGSIRGLGKVCGGNHSQTLPSRLADWENSGAMSLKQGRCGPGSDPGRIKRLPGRSVRGGDDTSTLTTLRTKASASTAGTQESAPLTPQRLEKDTQTSDQEEKLQPLQDDGSETGISSGVTSGTCSKPGEERAPSDEEKQPTAPADEGEAAPSDEEVQPMATADERETAPTDGSALASALVKTLGLQPRSDEVELLPASGPGEDEAESDGDGTMKEPDAGERNPGERPPVIQICPGSDENALEWRLIPPELATSPVMHGMLVELALPPAYHEHFLQQAAAASEVSQEPMGEADPSKLALPSELVQPLIQWKLQNLEAQPPNGATGCEQSSCRRFSLTEQPAAKGGRRRRSTFTLASEAVDHRPSVQICLSLPSSLVEAHRQEMGASCTLPREGSDGGEQGEKRPSFFLPPWIAFHGNAEDRGKDDDSCASAEEGWGSAEASEGPGEEESLEAAATGSTPGDKSSGDSSSRQDSLDEDDLAGTTKQVERPSFAVQLSMPDLLKTLHMTANDTNGGNKAHNSTAGMRPSVFKLPSWSNDDEEEDRSDGSEEAARTSQ
ncbi:unnamed protein product [Chrysoparadoxa australica]